MRVKIRVNKVVDSTVIKDAIEEVQRKEMEEKKKKIDKAVKIETPKEEVKTEEPKPEVNIEIKDIPAPEAPKPEVKVKKEAKKEKPKQETKPKKSKKKEQEMKGKVAIVRIRGSIGSLQKVKDTLNMLCLYRRNYCSVHNKTESILGMIHVIKDYVTWGEIDDASLKELVEKKAEKNPRDETRTKKFFRLAPPRGGFERKGIKTPFTLGGALGYRGDKIKELIKKMI